MACLSRADTLHKADTQSTIEERITCWCKKEEPHDGCKWVKIIPEGPSPWRAEECGTYWFMSGCNCGDCPCYSQ